MTTLLHDKLDSPSIYLPTVARIAAVRDLTEMEKLYTVELPDGYSLDNRPGQFVEVSVFGVGEAPISISSSPSRSNGSFEMCVRRAGDLTGVLHQKNVGDLIGVRGPFGRGFPVERFRGKDLLFAPGGLGLAPLRSLINQVLDNRGRYGRITILYGARTPGDLLFKDELAEWDAREDVDLRLTVDRGDETWEGNVGVITTLFPALQVYSRNTIAVVVGPPVMYRYVLMELLGKGIPEGNIWFSLERRMKCGVGKCGHCQMEDLYTCQSGPAFSYAEIKHIEEAI
jgi:sulfhydrogenase subunit gamma (sulfur reductase)